MPGGAEPQVTVLIPTFNRSGLLRRAVASVAGQSFKTWQLLISDNASTDDTRETAEALSAEDARIRYFRHETNIGMLGNWASLIGKVDTPYFCVLSDDDVLLPPFLEITTAALNQDSELGMCFGRTAIVDDNGARRSYAPSEMKPGRYAAGTGAVAMVAAQHPASTGTLFRASAFQSAGGFDPSAHYVADLDIMMRVASCCPTLFLSNEVAHHAAHAGNSFKDGASWFPGLRALLKNVLGSANLSAAQKEEITKCLVANAIFPLALQFLRSPASAWNPTGWRCAISCVAQTNNPCSIAAMFPGYLAKRALALASRKLCGRRSPVPTQLASAGAMQKILTTDRTDGTDN